MSICPEKDIHSIYLDNELPKTYESDFLNHINSCDKCKIEFKKLSDVTNLLKQDSQSLQFSEEKMRNDFEKLQTKLKYSKVVQETKPRNLKSSAWILPAAAAVVAFVLFVPINKKNIVQQNTLGSIPIAVAAKDLKNGISTVKMPEITKDHDGKLYNTGVYYSKDEIVPVVSFTSGSPFAAVDMFRPDFNSQKHISVKVTLDNIEKYIAIPVQVTVSLEDNK